SYYHQIIKAIEIIDIASQQVGQDNQSLAGRVKIGLLPSTYIHIQPVLFRFQDTYPNVCLDIRTITNGLDDLLAQGLDIAFHSGALGNINLVAKHLLSIERILVASEGYLERNSMPNSIDELARHETICFRWPTGVVEDSWALDNVTFSVSPHLIGDSIGFIKSATIAGRGISYLPKIMIQDELDNGCLIEVLPGSKPPAEDGWLLYPPRQTLNNASRALIDWIVERADELI
ncbi:substrate binding domain-containing protein, partial [Vibrio sp. FNV 38]|nr:substrate binding domain-containing protein [Vibrio sp. FNV 38]